jgi:hypothetical protein
VATPEQPQLPDTGPYLGIAVLCEIVLQEAGGASSVIRITDTINQTAVGPDAPKEMAPFMASVTMIVMIKAGEAHGSFGIVISPEAPGGFQLPSFEQTVHLAGGPWGATLIVPMQLPISIPGVYWFDVSLNDPTTDIRRLLTRVPLEVIYSRGSAS